MKMQVGCDCCGYQGEGRPVFVNRMCKIIRQLEEQVTGVEDTSWTTGTSIAPMTLEVSQPESGPGTAWSMYGLRYAASALPTDNAIDVYYHVLLGEWKAWSLIEVYGSPVPYYTGNGESGIHVTESNRHFIYADSLASQTHIIPDTVTEIEIPLLFSFRQQTSGTDTSNFGTHTIEVTHARAVINDEVAGPLTEISHEMQVAAPEEQSWYGLHNYGFNFDVARVAIPLDEDTVINPGDIVGFDVFVKVTQNDTTIKDTFVNALNGIFNYRTYNQPSLGWSAADTQRVFNDSWQLTYKTGAQDPERFDPEIHTFELDFGSTSYWTPNASESTFKMETEDGAGPDGGWLVGIEADRIYCNNAALLDLDTPPGDSPYKGSIVLSWDGEKAVLTFREIVPPAGVHEATTAVILSVDYEPQSPVYPSLAIAGHRQSGEFFPDGVTIFKAKKLRRLPVSALDPDNVLNPVFASVDSASTTAISHFCNLPDTITVSRVDR